MAITEITECTALEWEFWDKSLQTSIKQRRGGQVSADLHDQL